MGAFETRVEGIFSRWFGGSKPLEPIGLDHEVRGHSWRQYHDMMINQSPGALARMAREVGMPPDADPEQVVISHWNKGVQRNIRHGYDRPF